VTVRGDSGHAFKFAPVLGALIADVVEAKPNRWAHRFRTRAKPGDGADGARAKQ
jgi:glycine/D-amino acid oxidase-like deaminating enzyme